MKKKYVIWIVCLVCVIGLVILLYAGKDAIKNEDENSETFDSVFDDVNLEEDKDSSEDTEATGNNTSHISETEDAVEREEVLNGNERDNGTEDDGNYSENGSSVDDIKPENNDNTSDESHIEKFSVDEDTETKYGPIY